MATDIPPPWRPATPVPIPAWAAIYDRVRALEGRRYPDALVARLPAVPTDDPLREEWRQRADSVDRLIRHLERLARPLVVLELGCGNGWLAARIARIDGSQVVGLDVNAAEIAQARRVFGAVPNLSFVEGDAVSAPSPLERPTAIVLASVIQYVEDVPSLLRRLDGWLAPGGEIHLLDSPLYGPGTVDEARRRSDAYYRSLGVPAMAAVYRHHTRAVLAGLRADVLHDPWALRIRLGRRLARRPTSPFPWIRIRGLDRPSR
ncbi:MAG: class I SAM-dependent methyltransferase [Candidatus Limnocylindrales bacterium]